MHRWLTILAALLVILSLALQPSALLAQDPGQQGAVSAQSTAADPDADADAEEDEEEEPQRQQHTDPYLQYVQNAEVRISQMELSEFPIVRAFASVTDENGVLLRSLNAEDFTVSENDVAADEVRYASFRARFAPKPFRKGDWKKYVSNAIEMCANTRRCVTSKRTWRMSWTGATGMPISHAVLDPTNQTMKSR